MSDARVMKGSLAIAADIAAGRLASGYPTAQVFEDVRVTCWRCHGVTVFPVLLGPPRPAPASCAHCGVDI